MRTFLYAKDWMYFVGKADVLYMYYSHHNLDKHSTLIGRDDVDYYPVNHIEKHNEARL